MSWRVKELSNMTTAEKVAFLKAQLRQLQEQGTTMTVGNYRRVKQYYERRLEVRQNQLFEPVKPAL